MKWTTRPLSDRTAFTGQHEATRFRASWSSTLDLLEDELGRLDARDVVLEVDVTEADVRLDGMLRTTARVNGPAARLAFESMVGPLTYATDRFTTTGLHQGPAWQHNVRAIALGLKALRQVDDYGITRRGEQYAGFKALGAGTAMPSSHMTRGEAEAVITRVVGAMDRFEGRERYRRARVMAHPDRHEGDHTLAYEVDRALRLLEADR